MRLLKLFVIVVLVMGVFAVGMLNGVGAQDTDTETFVVMAGSSNGNVSAMAFAPSALKVHRGDTVQWMLNGFHNVHLGSAPATFIIAPEVDGQPLPQINPAVMMPSIQSGGAYTGGEAGSGIPQGPGASPIFSLVIDADPGTYTYYCDIHTGMLGTIEVVDDATEIPSPIDVVAQSFTEFQGLLNAGMGARMAAASAPAAEGAGTQVTLGARAGLAVIDALFPQIVVIAPGESVTWTLPADAIMFATLGSTPLPGFEQIVSMTPPAGEGQPPVMALTDLALNGTVPSGGQVANGDTWYTGLLDPGETYTLTFTEPGVYPYSTGLAEGAVVVMP